MTEFRGVRPRIATDADEVARLRFLIETQKLPWSAAGKLLGLTAKQVQRRIKKFGLRPQPQGARPGPGNPAWRGGKIIDKDGYVLIWCPGHPHARKHTEHTEHILEHRLVVEAHLGRYLTENEVVHHIDGNKTNNVISNLQVFDTNADHLRHELKGRCPKWTPEGRARIRAMLQRRKKA